MRMLVTIALTILITTPLFAHAAILINEVAWMGTSVSANDEWIELYNSGGDTVTVDGWIITDGAIKDGAVNPLVVLKGIIQGHTISLLKSTYGDGDNDDISENVLSYSRQLSNDGRTLTLLHADGTTEEDRVAGGTDWENIGGDNTTKDTAQRTSGGWVTGTPTPGGENVTVGTPQDEATTTTQTTTTQSSKTSSFSGTKAVTKPVSLIIPKTELSLKISAPTVGYVNQPVRMKVTPSGLGQTIMNSLRYTWNFGDTFTGTSTEITHTFRYPGNYVVVVAGEYAKESALVRHEITILPVVFSMSRAEDGNILIHNDASYEVNLSGFVLKGDTTLTLPQNTILLPKSTITVSASRVESGVQKMIALYDPKKVAVASLIPTYLTSISNYERAHVTPPFAQAPAKAMTGAPKPTLIPKAEILGEQTDTTPEPPFTETIIPIGKAQAASAGAGWGGDTMNSRLPYLGLIGLILLAFYALFVRKQPASTEQEIS